MKGTTRFTLRKEVAEFTANLPISRSEYVERAIRAALDDPRLIVKGMDIRTKLNIDKTKIVRTTVTLDMKVWERLKSLSDKSDLSMDQIVRFALEAEMSKT